MLTKKSDIIVHSVCSFEIYKNKPKILEFWWRHNILKFSIVRDFELIFGMAKKNFDTTTRVAILGTNVTLCFTFWN